MMNESGSHERICKENAKATESKTSPECGGLSDEIITEQVDVYQENQDKNENKPVEENLTSTFESFWNICNTIQGLPILAIPYALRNGGYVSLLTLLVIAVASNYTGQIIVKCLYETSKEGKPKRVRNSYVDVGNAFCTKYGGYMVLATQVVQLLFVATVYPLLVGRMIWKSFPSVPITIPVWTAIGGFAFLPNIFIRNLSQVAWTSIITVVAAKVIFVTVFSYSMFQMHRWRVAPLEHFDVETFPAALGILVASYLSQPFVPVIEGSMQHKNKFNSLMNFSYILMTILNVAIGVVAYISFYPNTAEVITNNLPEGNFRRTVNVMAALLAFTSFTLPMFTIFDVVQHSKLSFLPKDFGTRICSVEVLSFRLFFIFASVLLASTVPNFSYLLAFVGSVAGISLEFIFPPLFHLKIYYQNLLWYQMLADIVIIALGLAVSFSGAVFSGRSLIESFG